MGQHTMDKRRLGRTGPEVSAIGLGCMAMSGVYGPADRAQSIATIHAALEAGITLLDTGDFYGMGHNEMLIGEALRGVPRESYQLSVKFGAQRAPDGSWLGNDTRPAAVKTSLAYTLERLGADCVDIYRPARLDPAVPIEETVGAIAECIEAGWVRHVGLSEVGAETLRRASAVHPICDLQIEYAVVTRGIERAVLPTCRELGIGITAYGILSRGLIGGDVQPGGSGPGDFRAHSPRFTAENLARNVAVSRRIDEIAAAHGLTGAQLAIRWIYDRGDDVVPLVGARKPQRIAEAIQAISAPVPPQALAELEAAVPPDAIAGDRYAAPQMAMLDSER
jgi:aryl-alcohol dehydrogenase-like predicted oxidoreductase